MNNCCICALGNQKLNSSFSISGNRLCSKTVEATDSGGGEGLSEAELSLLLDFAATSFGLLSFRAFVSLTSSDFSRRRRLRNFCCNECLCDICNQFAWVEALWNGHSHSKRAIIKGIITNARHFRRFASPYALYVVLRAPMHVHARVRRVDLVDAMVRDDLPPVRKHFFT